MTKPICKNEIFDETIEGTEDKLEWLQSLGVFEDVNTCFDEDKVPASEPGLVYTLDENFVPCRPLTFDDLIKRYDSV